MPYIIFYGSDIINTYDTMRDLQKLENVDRRLMISSLSTIDSLWNSNRSNAIIHPQGIPKGQYADLSARLICDIFHIDKPGEPLYNRYLPGSTLS